jgi:hypothetical protein
MPQTYRNSYLDKIVRKHADLAPEAAPPPSSLQPLYIGDHVTHPATQQLLARHDLREWCEAKRRLVISISVVDSVADLDQGSGVFLTPGSGMGKNNQDPGPG